MTINIRIKGFRSIRDTAFDLNTGINVLIGPNGSGKSNLLAAIRFLSDTLEFGAAVAMGRAGGSRRNFRRDSNEIRFRVSRPYATVNVDGERIPLVVSWEIAIAPRGRDRIPAIAYEGVSVHRDGRPAAKLFAAAIARPEKKSPVMRISVASPARIGSKLFARPNGRPFQGTKEQVFTAATRATREFLRKSKKGQNDVSILQSFASLHPSIADLVATLKGVDEFNIDPESARQATDQLPVARMRTNGAGMSEVLHALQSRQFHRLFTQHPFYSEPSRGYIRMPGVQPWHLWRLDGARQLQTSPRALANEKLVESIESELSAAVPALDGVGTDIDATSGRRYVTFRGGGAEFRPSEVSDGTIKWLCLLIALHLPYSRIFQLEEPENFMHPWMQQRLIELIREKAKTANTIYLCSSHSATVLNCLLPSELLVISNDGTSTSVGQISDKDAISKYLEESRFGLGDLWVSGGLGGVP